MRAPLKRYGWWVSVCLLMLYVGSYFLLSRASRRIVEVHGIEGFYYVPVKAEVLMKDDFLASLHVVGYYVFYPVWWVDHKFLGGPDCANLPDDFSTSR